MGEDKASLVQKLERFALGRFSGLPSLDKDKTDAGGAAGGLLNLLYKGFTFALLVALFCAVLGAAGFAVVNNSFKM